MNWYGSILSVLIIVGGVLVASGSWRFGYSEGADKEEALWLDRVAELADAIEASQESGRSRDVNGDIVVGVLEKWLAGEHPELGTGRRSDDEVV